MLEIAQVVYAARRARVIEYNRGSEADDRQPVPPDWTEIDADTKEGVLAEVREYLHTGCDLDPVSAAIVEAMR